MWVGVEVVLEGAISGRRERVVLVAGMKRGRDPTSGVSIEVTGHGRVGMHSASCTSARAAAHGPRAAAATLAIPDLAIEAI